MRVPAEAVRTRRGRRATRLARTVCKEGRKDASVVAAPELFLFSVSYMSTRVEASILDSKASMMASGCTFRREHRSSHPVAPPCNSVTLPSYQVTVAVPPCRAVPPRFRFRVPPRLPNPASPSESRLASKSRRRRFFPPSHAATRLPSHAVIPSSCQRTASPGPSAESIRPSSLACWLVCHRQAHM